MFCDDECNPYFGTSVHNRRISLRVLEQVPVRTAADIRRVCRAQRLFRARNLPYSRGIERKQPRLKQGTVEFQRFELGRAQKRRIHHGDAFQARRLETLDKQGTACRSERISDERRAVAQGFESDAKQARASLQFLARLPRPDSARRRARPQKGGSRAFARRRFEDKFAGMVYKRNRKRRRKNACGNRRGIAQARNSAARKTSPTPRRASTSPTPASLLSTRKRKR